MKRRGFLGFMGGAVAAGPGMAKAAATQQMSALQVGYAGYGLGAQGIEVNVPMGHNDWAKDSLGRMLKASKEALDRERRSYQISALDPDTASLNSVSLGHKIRMSRDAAFWRERERRKTYLQGILDGLWE